MSNPARMVLASVVSGIYAMFKGFMENDYRRETSVGRTQLGGIRPVYGYRTHSGGGFNNLGAEADWWSSSVSGTGSWERALYTGYASVYRGAVARSNGLSVRCVRDLMLGIEIFAGVVTSYGLNKCA